MKEKVFRTRDVVCKSSRPFLIDSKKGGITTEHTENTEVSY